MMNNDSKKLSSSTAWLIAFGSVAAATLISYACTGLGQKVCAAIYFALVGAGGFAATYFTRAKLGTAIGAFIATGVVAAIAYFFLVNHIMSSATTMMGDAVSMGQQHTQAVQMGGVFGKFFGVVVAVVVFLETIIAGIGGSIAGSRASASGLSLATARG